MKHDLQKLKDDDEAENVGIEMPNMRHQQSHSIIPERYEHHHDPNQEEFRLIPDITDTAQKWKRYFPISYWFPMDVVATVTDIVMVIPQAMGYALVAGLPPIN